MDIQTNQNLVSIWNQETANHSSAVVDCIIFPNSSLLPGFMSFDTWLSSFALLKVYISPAPDVGWNMQIAWANSRKEEQLSQFQAYTLRRLVCFHLSPYASSVAMRRTSPVWTQVLRMWRAMWGRAVPANWSWAPSTNLDTRSQWSS